VDKRRVEAYWLSALEYDKLSVMVKDFVEQCKQLPAPAASKK
jgi:coenzyme F420-reducing hydrogenase delta subunit